MSIAGLVVGAFATALAAPVVVRFAGRSAAWLLAVPPAAIFAYLLRLAPLAAPIDESWPWVPSLGVNLAFRIDGFSLLYGLLISGVGTLVLIYAGAYFDNKPPASRAKFLTLILLFMSAMLGTVFADNLVIVFLFWEATSIVSFLLVGFEHKSPTARRAALQALLVTGGGGLALLGGVVLIGVAFGTYSLSGLAARAGDVAASPWAPVIAAAVILGAITKSAQFPFYFWLPNAMQAPTPASAYLHSATMVKLGVYLLARFEPLLAPLPGYRSTLITIGAATMLIAAVQALRATGVKGALAYSTVASLGILVLLVGLDGPVASLALVGFLMAHALYKAALFFCAGTVLHATGEGRLHRLGGLGKRLPLTALAACLASLSMAGIPPFFGFVSKELLFEAQIESSWETVPIAIAVAVNAVMVAVAAIVTLRPFFLPPRGEPIAMRHGETIGLLAGPLLLAGLGVLISARSDWVTANLIAPAVRDILREPVTVKVSLWHGFTPMLALSGLVVAAGAVIGWFWRPIHAGLNRLRVIDRISGDNLYEIGMRAFARSASGITRRLQHGSLRGYLATAIAALIGLSVFALASAGAAPVLDGGGRFDPVAVVILAVGVAAAFAATAGRSAITTLVATGLAGFAMALLFLVNGAPDLAITQFAVEALLVVLLVAFFMPMPARASPTRSRPERWRDGLLAGAFAMFVFVGLQSVTGAPFDRSLADAFEKLAVPAGFGRNVVNVILVDFRALDTLGETVVVAVATLVVWSVFRQAAARETRPAPVRGHDPRRDAFVLRALAPGLFGGLLLMSVFILFRGHNQPGGGFIGGLVAALAFGLLVLAGGPERAARAMRVHPMALAGAGILAAIASGLVPGSVVLDHAWGSIAGVKIGTTMIFDLGVYLAVAGGMTAVLRRAYREGAK